MDRQTFPWGRVAAAAVMVLLLILAGVVWLGVATEQLRTDVASLERAVRETPPPLPAKDTSGLEAEVKGLREALTKLTARVEALRAAEDTKALERLTGEIRSLAGKVEALAGAKAPAAKPGKPAKAEKPEKASPSRAEPAGETPPRPYYGPGYPGWPGY